jgi:hypothetical protein
MPCSYLSKSWLSRWRRLTCLTAIAALLWASAGGLVLLPTRTAAAAGPDALVRCNPADPSSAYTSDVEVEIYVEGVADLYGADAQLAFDTSLAQVVDAHAGLAGVQIDPLNAFMSADWVVRQGADNTAGTIWYGATQTNPTPPANGSGALARFTLHPLTYGSFTMSFTSAELATRDGEVITSTTQSCLVSFTTPLPTTTSLSPNNALANSSAFTLTVNGTNFIDGSVVYWGGAARPTTFVNGTQLQASIPATDLETAGPVSVTVVNPEPGGGESNPQTFTVNTHAHFSDAAYSEGESAGSAEVPVVLEAPSTITVTVEVSSTDGSATLADYGAVTETVTFAPGVVTQTVAVGLTADTLDEVDETVLLALGQPGNVLLGAPNSATLTILDDDDPPAVQFSGTAYTATESAGAVPIDVVLSTASGLTVTVAYSTTDLTADSADYDTAAGTLTFAPGTITQTFNVNVIGDMIAEPDETVALALGEPSNGALGSPTDAILTILDDEGLPSLAFEQAAYSVGETAGSVVLTVTLSSQSALTVTANYTSGTGTAASGLDYAPLSDTLTFAPGVTSQTITLTVLTDSLDEADETVPVALSAPSNAGLGVPSTAVVTIVDDDTAPSVEFSSSFYTATESAGTTNITATLSAVSGLTVTVIYSTTNLTAQGGLDYTPVSATLSIPPGQLNGVFTVAISNDALNEPNETVGLALMNPGNASLGARTSATLTILDNDAVSTVQFLQANYARLETPGTAGITVTLNAPSALTVTVRYTTTNGTALAGSDYVAATGTLTFTPGITTTLFNVSVISDTVDEPNETVQLTLGQPTNAVLGTPASAVLTILDDDVVFKLYFQTIRR